MPGLFKTFSRLNSLYTNEHEGTGLGLVLSERMVELHGGRMWAKSEPAKGSRFTFAIPVAPAAGRTPMRDA